MHSVNSRASGLSLGVAYHDASTLDVGLCFLGTTQPARKRAVEALQL